MNNLQQYSDLAETWWEESGPFQDLVSLIPVRFSYFDKWVSDWKGLRVLDLGCGGGFVAEELARRGARVVGVDPASALLSVARRHAADNALPIEYREGTGERIPAGDGEFDAVICVDVLEHVAHLPVVLGEVRRVLKPQGHFFYDTINRTVFSFVWMIVALEWIAGRIPRGTHDWRKFIRPSELNEMIIAAGLTGLGQSGIVIDKVNVSAFRLKPAFRLSPRMSTVYVGAACRPPAGGIGG
ncbi:MAG: 3-demethylubiquinone-9 3-O-methyltransferase [Proteobacteria bacterium]|nr:3-demethylubiquinone-9 3-O-methyltransferase [Pseudomonadota bacterium]